MASGVGGVAGIGAVNDARLDNDGRDATTFPTRVLEKLHDPSIPLEEYMHYAKITRDEEDRLYGPGSDYQATAGPVTSFVKSKILKKNIEERPVDKPRLSISGQGEAQIRRPSAEGLPPNTDDKNPRDHKFEEMIISDEEWVQASRAARTATWYAIHFQFTAFSSANFLPGEPSFT